MKDTAPPTARTSRFSRGLGFAETHFEEIYTVNLKHEHAACYVKARTFTCDGCATRTRYRDGYEVGEDNHVFFPGMWVCEKCAHAHGVL